MAASCNLADRYTRLGVRLLSFCVSSGYFSVEMNPLRCCRFCWLFSFLRQTMRMFVFLFILFMSYNSVMLSGVQFDFVAFPVELEVGEEGLFGHG